MLKSMPAAAPLKAVEPKQSWTRIVVCRVLNVKERQLKKWEEFQLVPHAESYAFRDLLALRKLNSLREQRVPAQAIKRSIEALRLRLKEIDNPLTDLNFIREGRRLSIQWHGMKMDALSGQLLLDFDAPARTLAFPNHRQEAEAKAKESGRRAEADRWFQKGLELEQTGAPIEGVIEAYRKAGELDPKCAGAFVNLGTIYFHRHELGDAEKHYKLALEANPEYALAHFNLGNLYDEQGNRPQALFHYRAALALNPQYADAHYNLALLHQASGHIMAAVKHWNEYLKLDASSSWANIARRELDKLRKMAIVPDSRQAAASKP